VTGHSGKVFGTYGAFSALPRRLVAKEAKRHAILLRRGVSRRTSSLVFGRKLLETATEAHIEARYDAEVKAGRPPLSENGFLRLLGLVKPVEQTELTRQSLLDQSHLDPRLFDLLSLFDAFERNEEPYSFRDLILARKYAGLVAGGANWSAIARSIHRSGPVESLTALSLQAAGAETIYAVRAEGVSELSGQMVFDLDTADDARLEEFFLAAEEEEADGRYEEAAALYQRCLAIDPTDAVAAFNRANCLRAAGHHADAAHDYARAIKLDGSFVEAWFNLAGIMAEDGRIESARRHLSKAIALDADYADAVFNLARLEFDAGDLVEARRLWARYLELDGTSGWAKTALRGIQFIDLQAMQKSAG
jgi:tetratricopeptide (TPR) repeat protein